MRGMRSYPDTPGSDGQVMAMRNGKWVWEDSVHNPILDLRDKVEELSARIVQLEEMAHGHEASGG